MQQLESTEIANISVASVHTKRTLNPVFMLDTNRPMPMGTCKFCGQYFGDNALVENHVRSQHEAGIRYNCGQCGRLFKLQCTLTRHMKTMHPEIVKPVALRLQLAKWEKANRKKDKEKAKRDPAKLKKLSKQERVKQYQAKYREVVNILNLSLKYIHLT
jgi:hypothetical protein